MNKSDLVIKTNVKCNAGTLMRGASCELLTDEEFAELVRDNLVELSPAKAAPPVTLADLGPTPPLSDEPPASEPEAPAVADEPVPVIAYAQEPQAQPMPRPGKNRPGK